MIKIFSGVGNRSCWFNIAHIARVYDDKAGCVIVVGDTQWPCAGSADDLAQRIKTELYNIHHQPEM